VKLSDLRLFPHRNGFQHKELFDNNYGISVIPEENGLTYEVAVLQHSQGRHTHLTYDTEITNDVIRYATVDDVDRLILQIRNLPAAT
jgi:hypothetical protein